MIEDLDKTSTLISDDNDIIVGSSDGIAIPTSVCTSFPSIASWGEFSFLEGCPCGGPIALFELGVYTKSKKLKTDAFHSR